MKIHIPAMDAAAVSAAQAAAINAAINPILTQQAKLASQLAASVLPNLDNLLPKIDFSSYYQTQQLVRSITLPHLEWLEQLNKQWAAQLVPPVLPKITLPHFELPVGMLDVLRGIDWELLTRRSRVPSNWPDEFEEYLPTLLDMVNIEGIPVAWVPRRALLLQLLDADSATERSELLISHRDEILEDCLDWVEHIDDDFLASQLPIAKKVLAACTDGHWEVAAISAVAVVHAVVESLHWVSDRQRVQKHHQLTMELPLSRLLEQSTRAPLVPFYDDWNPKSGKPRPAHLTRHVVSHQLAEDQVSARNCIVAVMLMSSLLVSVEQLELGRGEVAACASHCRSISTTGITSKRVP